MAVRVSAIVEQREIAWKANIALVQAPGTGHILYLTIMRLFHDSGF
ncbi:MAG: hypothetical protein RL748_1271 [Pseudomonadota bacterium]|jgi:hypothetical protein